VADRSPHAARRSRWLLRFAMPLLLLSAAAVVWSLLRGDESAGQDEAEVAREALPEVAPDRMPEAEAAVREPAATEDDAPASLTAGAPAASGAQLVVEVLEATGGAAVADCEVRLWQRKVPVSDREPGAGSNEIGAWNFRDPVSASTGADGVCRFEDLSAGRYLVNLHSVEVQAHPLDVELSALATRQVRLLARRLAGLTGLCVDASSKPVSGTRVYLRRDTENTSEEGRYSARSDSEGRFVLKGIPVDEGFRYSVKAEHAAYVDVPARDVTLEPGSLLDLGSFSFLERKSSVSGIIRHPSGEPAARLALELRPESDQGTWRTRTDSNGRFEFMGLSPQAYLLTAEPLCLGGSRSYAFVIPEGQSDLDLGTLEAREGVWKLHGTVVDEIGTLLSGAEVRVGNSRVTTDLDGKFELPFCEPHAITVFADWKPPDELNEITVKADFDAAAVQGRVVLRIILRGVLFHLVDEETGEALQGGAAQWVARKSGMSRSVSIGNLTSALLRYQDIEPGDWEFEVRVEGYRPWTQKEHLGPEVEKRERRIEVLLEKE